MIVVVTVDALMITVVALFFAAISRHVSVRFAVRRVSSALLVLVNGARLHGFNRLAAGPSQLDG